MEHLVVDTSLFAFFFNRTMYDFNLIAIDFAIKLHGNSVALDELRAVDIAVSGAVAQ